ncbi:polysaccharide biosynthesis protein [Bacteroidota bacterium]
MKKILVTGGSGFLGRRLIAGLLDRYPDADITTIARDGTGIMKLMTACPNKRLRAVVGDISSIETLSFMVKKVDTVIHLAALKFINLCETNPLEAISINISATVNLLRLFEGDVFIGMSTDKALEPVSCYGATKLVLEKLVMAEAAVSEGPRYMVVRSGNIFGSTGSVIDNWRQQLKQSNEIVVTNPEMTRFFIDGDVLAGSIINVLENGQNGNIYVPFQKAIRLADLAQAFVELYGDAQTGINIIGMGKGERAHEPLFLPAENVVTDLQHSSSEDAEKLSVPEIKEWLNKLIQE